MSFTVSEDLTKVPAVATESPETLPFTLVFGAGTTSFVFTHKLEGLGHTQGTYAITTDLYDEAGNLDSATAVELLNHEWTATMGYKVQGSLFENPHVFSSTGIFTDSLRQLPEFDQEAAAAGLVTWTTNDPLVIAPLFFGSQQTLNFAVTPAAASGAVLGAVSVDYAEVWWRTS